MIKLSDIEKAIQSTIDNRYHISKLRIAKHTYTDSNEWHESFIKNF